MGIERVAGLAWNRLLMTYMGIRLEVWANDHRSYGSHFSPALLPLPFCHRNLQPTYLVTSNHLHRPTRRAGYEHWMPQLFLLIENKIHWLAYLITSHHLYRPINLLDVLVMAHLFQDIFGVVAWKIHTTNKSIACLPRHEPPLAKFY